MTVIATNHIRRYGAEQNCVFRQSGVPRNGRFVMGLLYTKALSVHYSTWGSRNQKDTFLIASSAAAVFFTVPNPNNDNYFTSIDISQHICTSPKCYE